MLKIDDCTEFYYIGDDKQNLIAFKQDFKGCISIKLYNEHLSIFNKTDISSLADSTLYSIIQGLYKIPEWKITKEEFVATIHKNLNKVLGDEM